MPDFNELEQDARKLAGEHPESVDKAVTEGEQQVDQRLGGSHDSDVEKGGEELEKELGTYSAPQPPDPQQ